MKISSGIFLAITLSSSAVAEVTTDGSLGAAVTLQGDIQITPDLGQQRGGNLFHSFSQFDVNVDEAATFSGDVSNIFSRVTGSNASQVNGRISVDGNARLWLINPQGIVFGDDSSVDANGGFTALAGDSLRFSNGAVFSARLSENSTLSSAAPSAYGLLNAAAPLVVNGSIMVGDGSEVGLAGSTVMANAADIQASDGRVELIAHQGSEVVFNSTTRLNGSVSLDNSVLAVSGDQGGRLSIRAGSVAILNESNLDADASGTLDATGQILLNAGDIIVDNSTLNVDDIRSDASGVSSDSTAIDIRGDRVVVQNGGFVSSRVFSDGGEGRDVNIVANELLRVEATGDAVTEIAADALASGRSGNIVITGGRVELDGGTIAADGFGQGSGSAQAGSVTLAVKQLDMRGSSLISTAARGGASVRGSVSISASDSIRLAASGDDAPTISVAERGNTVAAAVAGDVLTIRTASLRVNGGVISTATTSDSEVDSSDNAGGGINIEVDSLNASQLRISSRSEGSGAAGNVRVAASHRLVLSNTEITAESDQNNGGNVELTAGRVLVARESVVSARASGRGGNLTVQAPLVVLDGRFEANAVTQDGGNIRLRSSQIAVSEPTQFDASSEFGADGDIEFGALESELPRSSEAVSSELRRAPKVVRDDCGRRANSRVHSSLRVRRRGGGNRRCGN